LGAPLNFLGPWRGPSLPASGMGLPAWYPLASTAQGFPFFDYLPAQYLATRPDWLLYTKASGGRLGEELATGKKGVLGFIANVSGNHWVAVMVDAITGVIWHGDPMGSGMDKSLEKALKWWTAHHLAEDFTLMDMDVIEQHDGYSCGILAWLALRVSILEECGKKLKDTNVLDERLQVFLNIMNHHDANVRSCNHTRHRLIRLLAIRS
jgi:hypothetical protein